MSPEQSKIDVDDEHSLATEPGEEVELEDVIPERADESRDTATDDEERIMIASPFKVKVPLNAHS